MKYCLSWLLDHLDGVDASKINIADLADAITKKTAHVEHWTALEIPVQSWYAAQIIQISSDTVLLQCITGEKITASLRPDVQVGSYFLVCNDGNAWRWVSSSDVGSSKDFLLPAIHLTSHDESWRSSCIEKDYVLDIDNNSISHRPDLWGHRGLAREISAILGVPLKPLKDMITPLQVKTSSDNDTNKLYVAISASKECSYLSGLYLSQCPYRASEAWMAIRLAAVEVKPISAVVDVANYAMLDIGHPMHTFDADKVGSHKLIARRAKNGETLSLLDGTKISLAPTDLVVATQKEPISLAGIMGGLHTAITSETKSVLLEAGCFDSGTIRRSVLLHKKRTDASTRFEKGLSAAGVNIVLQRFMFLLKQIELEFIANGHIVSDGLVPAHTVIEVAHNFLEERLGVTFELHKVTEILTKLEYIVERADYPNDVVIYQITVPPFRAVKDVVSKYDIMEEVGRFLGYSDLIGELPFIQAAPKENIRQIMTERSIRDYCSGALRMHELQSYAFDDEQFLNQVDWNPGDEVLSVQQPLSHNWRRLVGSLVPGLLNAAFKNMADHQELRFFEWNRIWVTALRESEQERRSLAGIIAHAHSSIDFYDAKQELTGLFELFKLQVVWQPIENPLYPWQDPHQTAQLSFAGYDLGYAGMVAPTFMSRILNEGSAFVFEIDTRALLEVTDRVIQARVLSKYPSATRDVSIQVPFSVFVSSIEMAIGVSDPLIESVTLIDSFYQPQWGNRRALTFRVTLNDPNGTMLTQQIDEIMQKIHKILIDMGATLR